MELSDAARFWRKKFLHSAIFFGPIFVLIFCHFFCPIFVFIFHYFPDQFSFLYSTIFPQFSFLYSIIPLFPSSTFVLIFHHFSAQFSLLYSPTLWLNFNSYIPPFFTTFHYFLPLNNNAPIGIQCILRKPD